MRQFRKQDALANKAGVISTLSSRRNHYSRKERNGNGSVSSVSNLNGDDGQGLYQYTHDESVEESSSQLDPQKIGGNRSIIGQTPAMKASNSRVGSKNQMNVHRL